MCHRPIHKYLLLLLSLRLLYLVVPQEWEQKNAHRSFIPPGGTRAGEGMLQGGRKGRCGRRKEQHGTAEEQLIVAEEWRRGWNAASLVHILRVLEPPLQLELEEWVASLLQ
jgi:hypothetical protein